MRILKYVMIVLILVSVIACQQPLSQNSVVGTLPNGESITAEEKAKLDSLKPQVDSIIEEVFGNKAELSDGKQFVADQSVLLEKVNALLKREFGDDYYKFIIKKEYPLVSVENTGASASSMVADTSSASAVSKSISGSYKNIVIGFKQTSTPFGNGYNKSSHTYFLDVTVGTVKSPWFSYNYATQYFSEYVVSYYYESPNTYITYGSSVIPYYPSNSQSITIWDGDASNTVVHTNSTKTPTCGLNVVGEMVFGYYPETKFCAQTQSYANDTNLYNNYCLIYYVWGQ